MGETIVSLTSIHYLYIIGVFIILLTMALRKDTLLPCIIFIFLIGVFISGGIIGGISSIFNAVVYSGTKFMDIIVIISLVSALSNCFAEIGTDYLLMKPGLKIMRTPLMSFGVLGITMFIFSLFLWPSPSVALIGAILLPVAVKSGLTPLAAAMAMNIFGHGIALSYDFVIQGAPSITAEAAGISPQEIMINGRPLFIIMSVVTVLAALLINRKRMYQPPVTNALVKDIKEFSKTAKIIAVLTPIAFVFNIIAMIAFDLKGEEATGLIGGTAVLLMCLGAVMEFRNGALEKITDYLRYGFGFGIKIFAPVIVIGAFFFIGGDGIDVIFPGQSVSQGIMIDWAAWLSAAVPLHTYPVAFIQMAVGALTGLDGSGFSGLPLVGSLAATFGNAVNADISILAALGQISAVWVGGGVLIPWGLIPVAAICNVDPQELARINFLPVMIGFGATLLMAIVLIG